MDITAKLDDWGKPAWITVMVLGFIIFWPIGLGILAYMMWSGRMGCGMRGGWRRWQNEMAGRNGGQGRRSGESSGNRAFDEYREETLRRLEEEQKEFQDFLDQLRLAKDKAEFDQFMAGRRHRSTDAPEPPADPAEQPA